MVLDFQGGWTPAVAVACSHSTRSLRKRRVEVKPSTQDVRVTRFWVAHD
jgi:hypothetical protein